MATTARGVRQQWMQAVPGVVREHRVLLWIVGSYIIAVALFHLTAGLWQQWSLLLLPARVLHVAVVTTALLLGVEALVRRGEVDLGPHRVLSAVLVLLLAAPLQSTFHAFKQTLNVVRPFTWDGTLTSIDRTLHGGRHPWEWLAPLVGSSVAMRAFDWLYFAWLPLLFGFLVWLAWSPNRALRLRALVTLALLWVVLGTVCAFVLSSAGPCFHPEAEGRAAYRGLMEALHAHHRTHPVIAVDVQYWLLHGYRHAIRMPFGGISAMPSLHVAVATLMALTTFRVHPVLGGVFALYAAAILVGSVVLGWHYAVDGYVSVAATAGLWTAAGRFVPRWGPAAHEPMHA